MNAYYLHVHIWNFATVPSLERSHSERYVVPGTASSVISCISFVDSSPNLFFSSRLFCVTKKLGFAEKIDICLINFQLLLVCAAHDDALCSKFKSQDLAHAYDLHSWLWLLKRIYTGKKKIETFSLVGRQIKVSQTTGKVVLIWFL